MKTTAAVLLLAAFVARAAAAPEPPKTCTTSIMLFRAYNYDGPHTPGYGYGPIPKDCVFPLDLGVVVLQKLSANAYVITGNTELYQGLAFDPAILLTSQPLGRDAVPSGFARYAGTETYEALDGFETKVPVFVDTRDHFVPRKKKKETP